MNSIIQKGTEKSSKKFAWNSILNHLPKQIHDEIATRKLPDLTGKTYNTVNTWRNIDISSAQDMPAIPFLILCKFFDVDPFDAINIDLPKETIKDFSLESMDELAEKLGLS